MNVKLGFINAAIKSWGFQCKLVKMVITVATFGPFVMFCVGTCANESLIRC